VDLFRRVAEFGQQSGNAWTILSGSVDYGQVLRLTGRLNEAEAVFRSALEQISQTELGQGFIGRLESFLASILLEKDQLDEACRLARSGVEHNRSWENPNHLVYGYLILARVLLALGSQTEAEHWLDEAERLCQTGSPIPSLRATVDSIRVRLQLQACQIAAAETWLIEHPIAPGPTGEAQLVLAATRARILIATGRMDLASELLSELVTEVEKSGQTSWQVELLCLLSLASPAEDQAHLHLLNAVNLGIPRGFRRLYLEDGPVLIARLARLQAGELADGVAAVLREMTARYLIADRKPDPADAGPLTAREREILALVAQGLSNPEIGARLYISAGTVKTHTAAIFRKLDCANRAEAVSRAKDLGLV
jgi:LuxR family transcriptional regulator, maltose regulon positive regulatory protein